MRLCANENIPEACVVRLRQAGHDVLWIRETTPGSPDNVVLALAASEDRLLITFDKDFGELISGVARRHRRASSCFACRSLRGSRGRTRRRVAGIAGRLGRPIQCGG